MDMKNLVKITDDLNEKISIGKKIYETRTDIYNDYMTNYIRNSINNNFKIISQRNAENGSGGGTGLLLGGMNKEELFYHSIYDYWVYGNSASEEVYLRFFEKTHEEKLEYFTARNRVPFLEYMNDQDEISHLNNKYEAYCSLKKHYKRDVILVTDESDFDKFCEFVDKHQEFVVKPDGYALGMGVHKTVLDKNSDIRAEFEKILNESRIDGADYHPLIRKRGGGRMVLEEVIDQDETMASLHPASINGLRCATMRVGDKVHFYKAWIKLAVNNEFIASSAVGGIDAGVNVETGVIETKAFDEHLGSFEYHPTTGVKILGFQIPRWNELLELLDEIGRFSPEVRYVGWDVVLSKKGWCIMEANPDGDFMWQLMYQKGFRRDMEKLVGFKNEKMFWWE